MKTNLIWIKLVKNLYNIIVRSLLIIIYWWYSFFFWGKLYYLIAGGIALVINIYILKRQVLTLRGVMKVADLLDEYLFLFFSNLRTFKDYITSIVNKIKWKDVKPFMVMNVKHTNRLKTTS